jgi:hypothetical protein
MPDARTICGQSKGREFASKVEPCKKGLELVRIDDLQVMVVSIA